MEKRINIVGLRNTTGKRLFDFTQHILSTVGTSNLSSAISAGGAATLSSERLNFCSEKGSLSPEAFTIFTVSAKFITPLIHSAGLQDTHENITL